MAAAAGDVLMELENDFTVPVPKAQAWAVLMDVERIAPCMPGATFDGYLDDDAQDERLQGPGQGQARARSR